jgi:phage regulator Rha-like protein
VIAVGFGGERVREGALELVERFDELAQQVLVRGLFGHEVRVADDAAGEEAVVGGLYALAHLGLAQVQVDIEVARWYELEVEGAQAVDFELKASAGSKCE